MTWHSLPKQRAWTDYITSKMLQRKQWQGVGSIDVARNRQNFRGATRTGQSLVRHVITGSLCGDNQRKHLPGEHMCTHCGEQPHTLHHTLWICSTTETTRQQWHEWLAASPTQNREAVEYPVFPVQHTVRDIWAIRRQVQLALPRFDFPDEAEVCIWTDGSMNIHPRAQLRESSWAIVADKCTSDLTRRMWAEGFKDPPPDNAFRTLQCGPTPGHQTIARAELSAACVALAVMRQGTLITDLQYVVHLFEAVKDQPDPLRYWNAPNYDLILKLCESMHKLDTNHPYKGKRAS